MKRLAQRRFGISTHVFHASRLRRDHLADIAAHGFDAIELFATRSHFDYHDAQAVSELSRWLGETRLELHSVHAPIFERLNGREWVGPFSNAARDDERRTAAVREARAALNLAHAVPYRYLVLHVGVPAGAAQGAHENFETAARRSIEETADMARSAGVRVALEVIPNALSSPEALVHLIEDQLDGLEIGICLDYGHAHLMGDVGDAIESVSGHLWTTHVHDNRGRDDDHLVPYAGTIDWDRAMIATQKIGYDGLFILEIAADGAAGDVLRQAAAARERLDRIFVTF